MSAYTKAYAKRSFLRPSDAASEAADARAWVCESCPTMTEPGERHCRTCKMYWQDVAAGLFDR